MENGTNTTGRLILGVVLLAGLTALSLLNHYFAGQQQQEWDRQLTAALNHAKGLVSAGLDERSQTVESLAAFMASTAEFPSREVFDRYAASSLARHPAMRALQYADADCIIRYVYPLAGNEAALNLDLQTRPAAPFVRQTMADRMTTISDPTRSVQGPQIVVIRTPIIRDDQVIGIAQGVIELVPLLSEVAQAISPGFTMAMDDRGGQRYWQSGALTGKSLTVPIGRWNLVVAWPTGHPNAGNSEIWLLWLMGIPLLLALIYIIHQYTERMSALSAAVDLKTMELQASESRFRTLIERAGEGIAVIDPVSLHFSYVNPEMCRLLQYGAAEMLHLHLHDIHPADHLPTLLAHFEGVAEGETHLTQEAPCITKAGDRVFADIIATTMVIDGHHALVTFYRDVSEGVRLRQENERIEAHLQQSQKLESIGVMAAGIAHEINNPIMGVSGYAELIKVNAGTSPEIHRMAGEIMREIARVHTIIRNLLGFARADEEAPLEPTHLNDIVAATLSLITTVMRHDQILLTITISPALPRILCRSQQLQQVLMNLLTNARDALNSRYPGADPNKTIQVTAEIVHKADTPWVRLTVEDHGVGIPESVSLRMFDPFFTTKPKDKGTGLGLWIVHNIIKEHGGAITAETRAGEFTRFHLDLPIAAPSDTEPPPL
jgi:PAS domain S-box-containing protein